MSRTLRITGRPERGTTTLATHAAEAEPRLHIHASHFRSTVPDVLLLARRLHRAAAAPVTHSERVTT